MNQQQPLQQAPCGDEIDLFELIQSLWAQRGLIMLVTTVIGLIAVGYSYLASPVYEATVQILPPKQADVAVLNVSNKNIDFELGVSFVASATNTTNTAMCFDNKYVVDVYSLFLDKLRSAAVMGGYSLDQGRTIDLQIKQDDPRKYPVLWSITAQGYDRSVLVNYLHGFVRYAAEKTKLDLFDLVSAEVDRAVVGAKLERESRFNIAGKKNNEEDFDELFSSDWSRAMSLIELKINYLESMNLDIDSVKVFALDVPAGAPDAPIKPKKMLIIVLGFLLGSMLGVFFALVRSAIVNRTIK